MSESYGKPESSEINRLIDSAIFKVSKTLTHIVENSAIDDHESDLVEIPTEDLVFLLAVCVDFLKGT